MLKIHASKSFRKMQVTQDILKTIADQIRGKFNPQKIILFGSYAKGNPGPDSDVDLFIIIDSSLSVHQLGIMIRKELSRKIPFDIIVRKPEQVEERLKMGDFFIQSVLKNGKEL
ncbi:MAG: nucleotidyltransferase domain-containing protein [Bacteroidetes bacterium]|nr:nucleotidyltransferase domain-containing protein [Bacteroidota bacterium]